MILNNGLAVTYDHRFKKIGHPVRSAVLKLEIGGLVVGSVTTSEYLLLYVFFLSSCFFAPTFRAELHINTVEIESALNTQ